jgi:Arc/MetJ-type ribon-helix-helix transcriptional regulator
MKPLIHARLSEADRAILDDLKRATGWSDSEVIRRGLRLVQQDLGRSPSALDAAGRSAGRFRGGPRDLSTNADHLEGFGR